MKNYLDTVLEVVEKIIGGLFVCLVSMISYLFLNYKKLESLEMFVLVFGIVLFLLIMSFFVYVFKKNLDKIKERDKNTKD